MSFILKKEDILGAFMNPVISRQVTQIIKANAMGFVLEPLKPEFYERKKEQSKNSENKWPNKMGPTYQTINLAHLDPSDQNNPEFTKENINAYEGIQSDLQAPNKVGQHAKVIDELMSNPVHGKSEPHEGKTQGKHWIVIKSGAKHGPFQTSELTEFVNKNPDQQRMLIKNTHENRILTVEFYLKDYLPNLEKNQIKEKSSSSHLDDQESPNVSNSGELESFENDSSKNKPQKRINPVQPPEHQMEDYNQGVRNGDRDRFSGENHSKQIDKRGFTYEANLKREDLNPRDVYPGTAPDMRLKPGLDPKEHARKLNMFTGEYSRPAYEDMGMYDNLAPNSYNENYHQMQQYPHHIDTPNYKPYPGSNMQPPQREIQGLPKYSESKKIQYPGFPIPGSDLREPAKPEKMSRYEAAIKGQIKNTKVFEQQPPYPNPHQYKMFEQGPPKINPEDYYGPNEGYGQTLSYNQREMEFYDRNLPKGPQKEFDYRDQANIYANQHRQIPHNPVLPNYPNNMNSEEPVIQKIEEDHNIDSLNNPYFLINELTKRNINLKGSQQVSVDLNKNNNHQPQKGSNRDGNSSPDSNSIQNQPLENMKKLSADASEIKADSDSQIQHRVPVNTGQDNDGSTPKDSYIQNIRSINRQFTVEQGFGYRDPSFQNIPNRQPQSETFLPKVQQRQNFEEDLDMNAKDQEFQKPSPVNSYMQNIMKINKQGQEIPNMPSSTNLQPDSSLNSNRGNGNNMNQVQSKIRQIDQSAKIENQDQYSQSYNQNTSKGNINQSDDRLDDKQNKFIEQVYLSKDLKKAKEGKGGIDIKLDNIFEKDVIVIPSNVRELNLPKNEQVGQLYGYPNAQPQGNPGQVYAEDQELRGSFPAMKQMMPADPKGRDPYEMYHQKTKSQAYPENQRFPQPRQPYGDFDAKTRGNIAYPGQQVISKQPQQAQQGSGGYNMPQYDPGYNPGLNYNQEYAPYRQPQGYQVGYPQGYEMQQDYGKFPPSEHGYPPNRPYSNKQDFNQYEFGRQYEARNYPPRKPQYGIDPSTSYGYSNQPIRGQYDEFQGYKSDNAPPRYNYAPNQQHQDYQNFGEGNGPYSNQRGYSQYEPPRVNPPVKYTGGYPNEAMQQKYKAPGYYGTKNIDQEPMNYYDHNVDDRSNYKSSYQKPETYKGTSNKNTRGKKPPKKKESDGSYFQSKQNNQSHNESGY